MKSAVGVMLLNLAAPGLVGAAESAHVNIASTPTGADVWIDGRPVGKTPLETSVTAGAHSIELRDSKHPPAHHDVWVPAGERVSLSLVLADRETPPTSPGSDLLSARFFPPELIVSHQRELGIDEKQRSAIVTEVQRAQSQAVPIQWQLQATTEQLAALLDGSQINEAKALAQAERVMNLERDLKRSNLSLLIRIKNLLTTKQQEKLLALRPNPLP
jgi:Spy/CpxP family protein refolding chaperone